MTTGVLGSAGIVTSVSRYVGRKVYAVVRFRRPAEATGPASNKTFVVTRAVGLGLRVGLMGYVNVVTKARRGVTGRAVFVRPTTTL